MGNSRLVQFKPGEFQAVYAGETIQLLPKEYALFEFLYNNRNRSFSREALLDHVWPLEEPSDRTVDDHIYRLRKKLKNWETLFTIDTIRGYGYRLTQKMPLSPDNPLIHDSEFLESVTKLFSKYHGMGMGAAMQTLAANQDVLGIEIDPFYRVYMHFVMGDFRWIVETDELAFWEKAFYLVHICLTFQLDAEQALPYFERIVEQKQLLPPVWQKDFDLNIIGVYLETGRIEQAKAQLEAIEPIITAMNSNSFSLIFHVKQLYFSIYTGDHRLAKEAIEAAEALLRNMPMQRELGTFSIAKGLWMYRQGKPAEAREMLDEGIEVLKRTKFVPHLINGVRHILLFLRKFDTDPEWKRKYEKVWQQLAEQYQFAELEKIMIPLLKNRL
ncbi:winged helix-turn-helix domain-containing protein [Brevibacillus sp. H7]|uniref:winged helix-turn-helix domain-containing protein n=1 Tax=Brevibacillus sp. H7 TaxID=3349138 RepID=UPI00380D30ED